MRIDHIGIAVRNLEAAVKAYESLGLRVSSTDSVAGEGVKVAFLPLGESRIELLEASSAESAVARFVEKRGEGIQHVALLVDNVERALREAKERGLQVIDEKPRIGAHGRKVGFVHPKSTCGVLVEFVEGQK